MLRLFVVIVILGVLYVAWDAGVFEMGPHRAAVVDSHPGEGPAQRVGAAVDKGLSRAGEVVEDAGKRLQRAADGAPPPEPRQTP